MECDAKIRFSLRRSGVRREVLNYLVNIYPQKSYPAEIARKIDFRLNEVCGALNGAPGRYKKENSLINLSLVKKDERKHSYLYTATDERRKIWKLISK
ncbi:MAG: archaellum operon transcriptional activator EarA family protein [Euryarchaeota archaeon]|nr:archaellum operon transcriptional activator EarA family protein [Euryarchaeota archaeon]